MARSWTGWLVKQRKWTTVLLIVLMLSVCGVAYNKYESYLESYYLTLCLKGSAQDLKQFLDKHGKDVNTIFALTSEENTHPELHEFFLGTMPSEKEHFTTMFLAAENKDPDVLKLLIARGASVTQDHLLLALANWRTENVLTLLEEIKNKKIDMPFDSYSNPAVTYFGKYKVENEHLKIFQELIDYHAFCYNSNEMFLDASRRVSDPNFYLILETNGINFQDIVTELLANAAESGNLETTKLFLQRGGNPNTVMKIAPGAWSPNAEYISMPLLVRAAMWNGGTDVLVALLEAGADPNARDSDGMTALMQLDKRIAKARSYMEELATGFPKVRYYGKNHKYVEPGSEEWREFIASSQRSELRHIERLEASRAALIQFGAKD